MQNTIIGNDVQPVKEQLNREKNLIHYFQEQVQSCEQKIAITAGEQKISYGELSRRSNQVAHMLCKHGVEREDIVAIFVDKTIDTIISILGILKAGAAYLPVDALLPDSRIEYMLRNGDVQYVMNVACAKTETKQMLKRFHAKVLPQDAYENYSTKDRNKRGNKCSLAYVMFTSGSEGKPKGVMIEDRGIIRLVKEETYFPFHREWNIAQTSTLVFDASIFEMYGALLNGATLHLIDKENLLNTELLKKKLEQQPIDMMFLTTPLFQQLTVLDVSIFDHVHNLVVGGDVLYAKYANIVKGYNRNIHLYNGYGPTENTTFSTFYEVPENIIGNVPIGKPISYSTAYILDANQKDVASGGVGELYVGGEGVGRGYLNDKELSKQKFFIHPDTKEMLYRTGDLARVLEDGNLEFLGRCDNQIKLRGFRIELSEIQAVMNQQDDVKECVVYCETKAEEKQLVAYVVLQEAGSLEHLKEQLRESLPSYMIPTQYFVLKKLPLNLNGKVDKHKLQESVNNTSRKKGNNTEENVMITLLSEQMNQDVTMDCNLYEIGFNSIAAIRVLNALQKKGYQISIKEILDARSVEELTRLVEAKAHKMAKEE